jgi:tetratricopeptide (TPR) repeat protein
MRTRNRARLIAALLPLVMLGAGCNLVRAKAAFKDGNRLYKEENYRKAIEFYERAVELKPDFAEAHFYLASSHQSLYRPGKDDEENRMQLDQALEHYEKSLEVNSADTPNLKQLRLNTLGALTAMYSDPPLTDYEKALAYAEMLVKDNPDDTKNLYAMANLYEKFGRVTEAEQTYVRVTEQNPNDAKACGALAAFYNKPLWDEAGAVYVDGESKGARRAKFDSAISTLERCAALDSSDPSGYYKLAMFFWDKAYRDPMISDQEKDAYADKGIASVDKALGMKPDYWEAIITKGLLYRVKAQVSRRPAERKQYLDQAVMLQKQAMELRKETQAAAAGGAAGGLPPAAAEAVREAPQS